VTPVTQPTVRALQRELTARGYDPGPADGNIGLLTHAAIMAFEHDEGLPLTGEPSERLLRRMILGASLEDVAPRTSSGRDRETAERLIKGVQSALAGLKYAPGQTDGTMTADTSRAIREFEMDQGLVPSGRISGRLIVRLARASGKAFVIPVR
jgi:peptidoglycan hydrolase-like protein with peptidoglycan-binding domain